MCRWLAYTGSPVLLTQVLYTPVHSLIGDLPGAWVEMPEASYGMVSKKGDQLLPFAPKPPHEAR